MKAPGHFPNLRRSPLAQRRFRPAEHGALRQYIDEPTVVFRATAARIDWQEEYL
jgi:hypothetical protein